MPDTVHHVMWYTVYDAKNGNLLASGTSDMCARGSGIKVQTVSHPRFIIAAVKKESRTSIHFFKKS